MGRILIVGCGYVGSRLADLLVEDGREVIGVKRDPSSLPEGIEGIAADVTDPASLDALPGDVDGVVYAVSPSGREEAAYRAAYVDGPRAVIEALQRRDAAPRRMVLVSSTGVYGQTDGRVVDEETDPAPSDSTGRILLEGEDLVRAAPWTSTALRLGGIYGPGRTRTVRRVLAGEAACPEPGRYGNRIHRDDAAGAARHLLDLDDVANTWIGVDRDPAPLRTVYRWIAERGGVPDPCEGGQREGGEPEGAAPSARRGTNKRCSSDRLAGSGYVFRYPTFREGYGPLVDELASRD